MRHDPLYSVWIVNCPSPEESRRLQDQLTRELHPDTTFVNEVRTFPGGVEMCQREPHRLGDYFESVRVLPATGQQPASFRLLFRRRPNAGRFWKDLMAMVLHKVRSETPPTTTTLEYRGDEDPEGLRVGA
jgi:hypothetical protein